MIKQLRFDFNQRCDISKTRVVDKNIQTIHFFTGFFYQADDIPFVCDISLNTMYS